MTTTTITMMLGDGIGPETSDATLRMLDAHGCAFVYEKHLAGLAAADAGLSLLSEMTLESIARNKVALKRPLTSFAGRGFSSKNVQVCKEFDPCSQGSIGPGSGR